MADSVCNPQSPQLYAGKTKVIGPFDGNNNNDGDLMSGTEMSPELQQQQQQLLQQQPGLGVSSKQEKMELNMSIKNAGNSSLKMTPTSSPVRSRKNRDAVKYSRNSLPPKQTSPDLDGFDVYNIETALPKIDWEAMEAHLRAAREEERRRRNDREEIRRRLAMGIDAEEDLERLHGRKQSLQSRLQSNMNLQICFMNETASDGSDSEAPNKDPMTAKSEPASDAERALSGNETLTAKDTFCSLPALSTFKSGGTAIQDLDSETDFFTKQAKLQMEARTALAQAKELARVQMQVERQQRKRSLISDFVRQNLEKTGLPFAWDLRRLSRQVVNELSVAQLQVIVNDLHTQIEGLNEELVQQLMQRDDFHMEQDSMLVDIEDLTRYLTAKQQSLLMDAPDSGHLSMPTAKSNPSSPSPKQRLRSLRLPILRK